MRVPSYRRSTFRRIVRFLGYVTAFIVVLDLYTSFTSYKTLNLNLAANTVARLEDLPSRSRNQQIYIVAQFWTSAEVVNNYWAQALLDLIYTLGNENIYLSILESGSLDNTPEVLEALDGILESQGVRRTIVIDPITHKDIIEAGPNITDGSETRGWIYTGDSIPPGKKELRRIPYLAELRNRGLKPLLQLQREQGITYDKILYLNDVIFKPSDVLSLLATNNGVYDVACALDFHYPPDYYDTFVLRDSEGHTTMTREFPFFRSRNDRSLMKQGLIVPVKSCWNGMAVVDAAPYYDQDSAVQTYDLDGNPVSSKEGLRFRGIPDALAVMNLEASECCLIHADLASRGQVKKGIYINPAVRVGYANTVGLPKPSYDLIHQGPDGLGWLTLRGYFHGVWRNRYVRWTRPVGFGMKRVWRKIDKWQREGLEIGEVREEVGSFCTVEEMQIITWNGWKHVW